jgi:SAM-dependent methyltransferase
MDQRTTEFYERYADGGGVAAEAAQSAMAPFVLASLSAGATVLDVGAGSGRDVARMLGAGIDAWGIEPNRTMRDTAISRWPELCGRLRDAALPALGRPFEDRFPEGFDAVVCSAVLMHIQPADIPQSLRSLVAQLRAQPEAGTSRTEAMVFISLPTMAANLLAEGRDRDGRRFCNHDLEAIEREMKALGLTLDLRAISDAALGTSGTTWHTLAFRRTSSRPG